MATHKKKRAVKKVAKKSRLDAAREAKRKKAVSAEMPSEVEAEEVRRKWEFSQHNTESHFHSLEKQIQEICRQRELEVPLNEEAIFDGLVGELPEEGQVVYAIPDPGSLRAESDQTALRRVVVKSCRETCTVYLAPADPHVRPRTGLSNPDMCDISVYRHGFISHYSLAKDYRTAVLQSYFRQIRAIGNAMADLHATLHIGGKAARMPEDG